MRPLLPSLAQVERDLERANDEAGLAQVQHQAAMAKLSTGQ